MSSTGVDSDRRSAREIVIHPQSPSGCSDRQDSGVTTDLCGVLPLAAEEMGEETVRRISTNSVRLPMDYPSTNP